VKDFYGHSMADVRQHLPGTVLLDAARADQEAVGKRMPVSYRLGNQTSHSFKPEDPG